MGTKEIPLLAAADIECRVQSIKQSKKTGQVGAILLLYKDARVDMRILDEVFGRDNWQRTHEVINGNLFCNIDIWDDEKKSWVRKQDVGTESNTEKEKGQASDSFKRAGTNVGIGRELYTAPFIYVALDPSEHYQKGQNLATNTRFEVKDIGYNDRREINRLVIADGNGKIRYTFGHSGNSSPDNAGDAKRDKGTRTAGENAPQGQPDASPSKVARICNDCGKQITEIVGKSGNPITADKLAALSQKNYGLILCAECQAKRKAETQHE